MTTKTSSQQDLNQSEILKQDSRLPIYISVIGIALFLLGVNKWATLSILIFGVFLLIQSFILRLEFTSDALVVWQLNRELRRFPFKNWLAWRLFLPQLPGILYFREEASPHLLPILFDPDKLESQLRLKVGSLEKPNKSPNSLS